MRIENSHLMAIYIYNKTVNVNDNSLYMAKCLIAIQARFVTVGSTQLGKDVEDQAEIR